jgi:hypothetical protein
MNNDEESITKDLSKSLMPGIYKCENCGENVILMKGGWWMHIINKKNCQLPKPVKESPTATGKERK